MGSPEEEKFDIIIPFQSKDSDVIELCISGCRNNIPNIKNVYLIGKDVSPNISGIRIINEDDLFGDGLNADYILNKWEETHPGCKFRAGWFLQQFIKMGCSYAIRGISEYYLVLDADLIFLRKVRFFQNGRMLLTKSPYYHQPYINMYQFLFGEPARNSNSYVSHHMLVSKKIMLELLQEIEKRFNKPWYDAIIENVDRDKKLWFSEYETYGHYLENRYPHKFKPRRLLNIERFWWRYLPCLLFNIAQCVTIHSYKKPINNPKTNPYVYNLVTNLVKHKVRKQTKRRN